MQKVYFGHNSISNLKQIFRDLNPANIFLVTGKKSYTESGALEAIESLIPCNFVRFSDFSTNPTLEDTLKGIELFKKNQFDLVIAVGGGSVMDMAKLICVLSAQKGNPKDFITNKKPLAPKTSPLIAVPTTSGSGSEATKFAVVYINKIKHSLEHDDVLPDFTIVDPQFMMKMSGYQTAVSGFDALCQAIEAYWSVNSTDESIQYSTEAIQLCMEYLVKNVNEPDETSREKIAKAALLAGQAINITRTTAPHALSYKLTSDYGIDHGHAVSLTLPLFLIYNFSVSDNDCNDERGAVFVQKRMQEIFQLLEVGSPESAAEKFKLMLEESGLPASLDDAGITHQSDIETIFNSADANRMKNNPRKYDPEKLIQLLYQDFL